MAACGGAQPVQGFADHGHRTVETERAVGERQVVVDGLGHPHHGQPQAGKAVSDGHGAVAADGHHRVQAQFGHIAHGLGGNVGAAGREIVERVAAVVRAQDGAAFGQDAGHPVAIQRQYVAREQAEKAAPDAGDAGARLTRQRQGHSADDGVQARAIAAACEDADVHGG